MTRLQINRSFFATALTTAILWQGSAQANDAEQYFYPKHKWSIEEIAKTTNNNKKLCSLTNQLNNGYTIQFVGNSDGVKNINLDIRQKVLTKNKPYEVVYSLPSGTKTIAPTRAFSKSMLVSDMRKSSHFLTKISQESVIDISIQGTQFRAYLTGLSAAMEKYKECLQPTEYDNSSISRTDINTSKNATSPQEVARIIQQLNERVPASKAPASHAPIHLKPQRQRTAHKAPAHIQVASGNAAEIISTSISTDKNKKTCTATPIEKTATTVSTQLDCPPNTKASTSFVVTVSITPQ